MKEVIYIRTSTEEQNPLNQLEDCKTLVKGDFELIEERQSAFKDKDRPLFEGIRIRIKSGNVSDLYCWDWDRLFRNRQKLIDFFKFCEIYDCKIHSYRQKYFEDFYKIPAPFNEIVSNIVLNLMGHNAEEESRKKSARVKLAVRKENGKPTKSYKGNKWGRKSLPQKVIDEVLKLRSEGMSMRVISNQVFYWDSNNNKKQISKSTVHKILHENPSINR